MIATEFYRGQGFGNQLWLHAVVTSLAYAQGQEYGFVSPERFKGIEFMRLDFGVKVISKKVKSPRPRLPSGFHYYYQEPRVFDPSSNIEITPFFPELFSLSGNTFIDGCFQSPKYLVLPKETYAKQYAVPSALFDGCSIHFRGSDYKQLSDVFLPKSYFTNAINLLLERHPHMKFRVITDDPKVAKQYFDDVEILSSGRTRAVFNRFYIQERSISIGEDFSRLQNSRYLILSNSSFSWWSAFSSSSVEQVIAPKYWMRFNISNGYWSLGDSLTPGWTYLDRNGQVFTYEECRDEQSRMFDFN